MTNVNTKTGIRFGIISANALDPEVIDKLQQGRDVHYEEAKSELWASIKQVCGEHMSDRDSDAVADMACERLSDHFEQDEPVHEFEIDCPGYGPVKGRTTWLGGALLVWIFESPFMVSATPCSPCVPNCGDLDNVDEDGVECYDVPADWRYTNE